MHAKPRQESPRITPAVSMVPWKEVPSLLMRCWVLDILLLYFTYLLSHTKYFMFKGLGSENLFTVDPLGTELNGVKTATTKSQVQQCTSANPVLLQRNRCGAVGRTPRSLQAREPGIGSRKRNLHPSKAEGKDWHPRLSSDLYMNIKEDYSNRHVVSVCSWVSGSGMGSYHPLSSPMK